MSRNQMTHGASLCAVPHLMQLVQAVIASADVIRKGWRLSGVSSEDKPDGTIVTVVDRASQEAAHRFLKATGQGLWYEEGFCTPALDKEFQILLDPLDGTNAFKNGATTSTACAALYETARKRVVACVVIEPASGRLWVSAERLGTWRCWLPEGEYPSVEELLAGAERCTVWDGKLSSKSMVYTDCTRGFTKEWYPPIPDEVWAGFLPKLFLTSRFQMYGTNCGHHALVANGGEGVAAAITTAIGGPWDVAPVHLVLEAGGAARAISTLRGRVREIDPLRVDAYSMVVSGNSHATVNTLTELLMEHLVENGMKRE